MLRGAAAATLLVLLITGAVAQLDTGWPNVGNDKGGTRYSALDQINRSNVRRLKPAWVFHTGDLDNDRKTTIECTPIVIGHTMYLTSAFARVFALDAASGRELWRFDPYVSVQRPDGSVNRGVAYWSDGGSSRIFEATVDGRLIALDAHSGKPAAEFGNGGTVDLRAGMERNQLHGLLYGVTSAPAVFRNLVMVGFYESEGPEPVAPGDIRAFDTRTGRQVWRFHTVPRPGELGHATWADDSWRDRGGANAWGGLTIDEPRGILFAGLGSAAFDFYGGDRHGRNLFADSVVALNALTGKRLWHFQVVRHDLWDYDLPAPPVLVHVRHDGRLVDAVAQVTKTGYVFLLDRVTGRPLFPLATRRVPASDVPGEQAWPEQVLPLKPPPFSRQSFEETDATDLSPEAHAAALEVLRRSRHGSIFTPPSLRGTIVFPGFHGGANWSGGSFDPSTARLYVNSNDVPWLLTLIKAPPAKPYPYDITGYFRFLDADGYPAVKPPWGRLNAIDLNRGAFAWRALLGEFPELASRGIPQTGTENFGGTIVTAGGLVFIGGTKDEKFHAFDSSSGSLLWEYKLPAGGYATPATYAVNERQFVVIAAGGGGKLQTQSGDAFYAFALAP